MVPSTSQLSTLPAPLLSPGYQLPHMAQAHQKADVFPPPPSGDCAQGAPCHELPSIPRDSLPFQPSCATPVKMGPVTNGDLKVWKSQQQNKRCDLIDICTVV